MVNDVIDRVALNIFDKLTFSESDRGASVNN